VVLEGADGSGKSTQAQRLAQALADGDREVLPLRDPGSTRLAEAIREILLGYRAGRIGIAAEVGLYLAARAQLAEEVIAPALHRGALVLCERWTLSTEVYQGLAGGFGAPRVRKAAELVVRGVRPDLVVVLDVVVGEGLRRIGREPDRVESKGARFHAAVVRGYRKLARGRPRHVVVPPGSPDEVHRAILDAVRRRR
jgi:dTMP kinase